jgi:phosphinothricin acetyltransferase
VGYAYANAYRPRPGYRFTVEDSVYSSPDAQGKGIGSALLNALIVASSKAGFRLMVAVIGVSRH